MKKLFVLFRTALFAVTLTFCFSACSEQPSSGATETGVPFAQEQPNNLLPPDQLIQLDSSENKDSATFNQFSENFVQWFGTCGADLQNLIRQGKVAVPELVSQLTGAPKPNTKEGVEYWTDKVDWIWATTRSVATTLIVFFLSLFKSKEEAAEAAEGVQKWFDGIKTRWLLAATAPIVTIIGLVAFKGDGWTWLEAAGWLVGTGSGAILVAMLTKWIPFLPNLMARKVKKANA